MHRLIKVLSILTMPLFACELASNYSFMTSIWPLVVILTLEEYAKLAALSKCLLK